MFHHLGQLSTGFGCGWPRIGGRTMLTQASGLAEAGVEGDAGAAA